MNFKAKRKYHLRLGRWGERQARKLLKAKNCDILLSNFKISAGEIDIIARDGAVLVFVEVKTRHRADDGRPAGNLSTRQKRRIFNAGRRYLNLLSNPQVIYRFDLIEVVGSPFSLRELRHWENHFSRDGLFR